MANKRKSMLQIRKILQLLSDGCGFREISRATVIHRKTIKDYVEKIKGTGKTYEVLLSYSEADLIGQVVPPK